MNLIVNSENRDEIEPKYKTYNIKTQILKDRERWKTATYRKYKRNCEYKYHFK